MLWCSHLTHLSFVCCLLISPLLIRTFRKYVKQFLGDGLNINVVHSSEVNKRKREWCLHHFNCTLDFTLWAKKKSKLGLQTNPVTNWSFTIFDFDFDLCCCWYLGGEAGLRYGISKIYCLLSGKCQVISSDCCFFETSGFGTSEFGLWVRQAGLHRSNWKPGPAWQASSSS